MDICQYNRHNFPHNTILVEKICVIPGFNQTALHEVGYQATWEYFICRSKFNGSVFGWAGHDNDSRILGTVEVILAHVTDYKVENVIDKVWVWTRA